MSLLPHITLKLAESSAQTLEWPRLREYVAGHAQSPLGRGWVMALEASADRGWIETQQQRTEEVREFLRGGGSFAFHGMFDPTELLEQARVEGAALEGVQLLAVLGVVEKIAGWKEHWPVISGKERQMRGSLHSLPTPASKLAGDPVRSVEMTAFREDAPLGRDDAFTGGSVSDARSVTSAARSVAELSRPVREWNAGVVLAALKGKVEPDGTLSDEASGELRRIRRAMERQHRAIEESLRKSLRALSAEGSAQEELITVRGERFVIPVKAEFRRKVPGVIHGSSSSGQTVFVEPLETIEQNNEMQRLLDEEQREVHRILVAMTRAIGAEADAIAAGTAVLAEVESHFARGRFAEELGCVRPGFGGGTGRRVGESAEEMASAKEEARTKESVPQRLKPGSEGRAKGTAEAVLLSGTKGKYGDSDSTHPSEQSSPGTPATSQNDASKRMDGAASQNDECEGTGLRLVGARHPLLELRLRRSGGAAVPIKVELREEARQLIISGPNTGGKTVALKTVGLLAVMAQAGLPVPAETAVLPLFTAIYADIGDAQSIESNLSSFSAHVVNVDRIARAADANSLVLLDELGSATDPEEGSALAVAVAEHFLRVRAWCCITTHLTSLKVYAASHQGVLNAAVGFDQERMAPTYALRMGVPGASAGLNIAERLGLLAEIVTSARANMTTQAADIGALLDQLHAQLAQIADERAAMQIREGEIAKERLRLETEGRAEQKARTKELEAKLGRLLDDFAWHLQEAVKAVLDKKDGDKAVAKKLARDAGTTIARARREFTAQFTQTVLAHTTGADKGDVAAGRATAPKSVKVGDVVKVKSLGREGRVERVIDTGGAAKSFEVQVGTMKMRVALSDIAEVMAVAAVTPLEAARRRGGVTVQMASGSDSVPMEINVIGRTAEEAHDEVARYLDRAFLAGLPHVRIVHGTGMGVLRRTLREYLKGHPNVANVTEPEHNQGGQGATEVELRQ